MTQRQLAMLGIAATIVVGGLVVQTADGDLAVREMVQSIAFVTGAGFMWMLIRIGKDD